MILTGNIVLNGRKRSLGHGGVVSDFQSWLIRSSLFEVHHISQIFSLNFLKNVTIIIRNIL